MNNVFFSPRNIPWKFRVDSSIRSVSGRGGQEGGDLEDVEGSWPETWRTWLFLTSSMMFFLPQWTYPENFMLICLLKVCQERGVLHWVTWRTLRVPDRRRAWQCHPCHSWSWSFPSTQNLPICLYLMLYMILFDPKEDTLKMLCWYHYHKCVKYRGSGRGLLGGC